MLRICRVDGMLHRSLGLYRWGPPSHAQDFQRTAPTHHLKHNVTRRRVTYCLDAAPFFLTTSRHTPLKPRNLALAASCARLLWSMFFKRRL